MEAVKLIRYDEVPFHDDVIPSALVEKHGRQVVVVHPKSTCERLGVDWSSQHRNIKDHPVWSKGMVLMTMPSLGGGQATTMLELRYWLLWLANIDPRRVHASCAQLIVTYQEEAAEVLEAHFLRTVQMMPQPAVTQVEALLQAVQIMAEQDRKLRAIEAAQEEQQAKLTVLDHRVNNLDLTNIEGTPRQRLVAMIKRYAHQNGITYQAAWRDFDNRFNTAYHTNLTARRNNYTQHLNLRKVVDRPEYLEARGQIEDAIRVADKMLNELRKAE